MPDLETRVPPRRFPFLAVLPWLAFALAAAWDLVTFVAYGFHVARAWHYVLLWLRGPWEFGVPFRYLAQLASPLFFAVSAALLAASLVRVRRAQRRVPRGGDVVVRVGKEGLYVDGALAVARDEIARAALVTHAETGVALVVRARDGAELTIPVPSEERGRELLASLGHDDGSLTFGGVTGPRGAETARATLISIALVLVAAFDLLGLPRQLAWWLPPTEAVQHVLRTMHVFFMLAGNLALAAAVAFAVRPLARRLSSAARVERDGVRFGDADLSRAARFVPFDDVERVASSVLPFANDLAWKFPLRSAPHEFFLWLGTYLWAFGFIATGAAVAALLRPIARVFSRAARVAREGVCFGDAELSDSSRFVAFDAMERVEAGDANDVRLVLRDGTGVRLRFSDERPVSERELFIERVRDGMESAGVTSCVRVAPAVRVEEREVEAPVEEEDAPDARRARRA